MDSPTPPDPMATAQAQQQMNNQTAINQQQLNMVDQYTPDGSLTYSQVGGWGGGSGGAGGGQPPMSIDLAKAGGLGPGGLAKVMGQAGYGTGGSGGGLPHYAATTSLSVPNQKIYDTNQATKQNIANIGRDQSARIGDWLGTPLKLGNEATEARLMELGSARLDPKFAQSEEALRTRLANNGIRAGTAAFDAEMRDFNSGKNDAYNSLLLNGRQMADTEMMAERNSPINEITALMSGSQVSNPNFVNTPQTQVGGVDYMGAVNNNYNQQVASNNAMMGGMFGLAGAGVTAGASLAKPSPTMLMLSDRRAKYDIDRVGTLDNGLPIYSFKYKGSDVPQIGLMADEVERLYPGAVAVGSDGFKRVDYAQAVRA